MNNYRNSILSYRSRKEVVLSMPSNASSRSEKKTTDNIKRRLQSVSGCTPYAIYFGFVPLIIYLGFKLGPDPGTPEMSVMNLLPIG